VQQHSTAINSSLLKGSKQGFHIWGSTHGRAGLYQPGLLPEGLEGSVVEEEDWDLH
jgi:hypothetical protein